MGNFTLVTGGARSGKSRFAELLATHSRLPVTYIATAQIWDKEMANRVEKHRQSRPSEWNLIEEPYHIEETLLSMKENNGLILLDCVTIWLSNLLLADSNQKESDEAGILTEVTKVAQTAVKISPKVIFVTNEVGQGIVPDNPLARAYRDLAGRANQILAEAATNVYFVVAGYPLEIKHQGQQLLNTLHSKK
ncbi:MAG: bifunctional adenosylcobinamide kinase/adenosylcobinamide-phosphate guanylyltransferase [Desulfitobacteriaceae bacterium]